MIPDSGALNPVVHLVLLYNKNKAPADSSGILAKLTFNQYTTQKATLDANQSFLEAYKDYLDFGSVGIFLKSLSIDFMNGYVGSIVIELIDSTSSVIEALINAALGTKSAKSTSDIINYEFLNFNVSFGYTNNYQFRKYCSPPGRADRIIKDYIDDLGTEVLNRPQLQATITEIQYDVQSDGIHYTLKGLVPTNDLYTQGLVSNVLAANGFETGYKNVSIPKGVPLYTALSIAVQQAGKGSLLFIKDAKTRVYLKQQVLKSALDLSGKNPDTIINEIVKIASNEKMMLQVVIDARGENAQSAVSQMSDALSEQKIAVENFLIDKKMIAVSNQQTTGNQPLNWRDRSLNELKAQKTQNISKIESLKTYEISVEKATKTKNSSIEGMTKTINSGGVYRGVNYSGQSDVDKAKAIQQEEKNINDAYNGYTQSLKKEYADSIYAIKDESVAKFISDQMQISPKNLRFNSESITYVVRMIPTVEDIQTGNEQNLCPLGRYRYFSAPMSYSNQVFEDSGVNILSISANMDKWLIASMQQSTNNYIDYNGVVKSFVEKASTAANSVKKWLGDKIPDIFDNKFVEGLLPVPISEVIINNVNTISGRTNPYNMQTVKANVQEGVPDTKQFEMQSSAHDFSQNFIKNELLFSMDITTLGDIALDPILLNNSYVIVEYYIPSQSKLHPILSGKWLVRGYRHEISSGKFTTTMKLFNGLPAESGIVDTQATA